MAGGEGRGVEKILGHGTSLLIADASLIAESRAESKARRERRAGNRPRKARLMIIDPAFPTRRRDNWVDRFAPERLRPWLKLGRFDRPAGIWLLLLPGWQGIALAAAMRRPLARPAG